MSKCTQAFDLAKDAACGAVALAVGSTLPEVKNSVEMAPAAAQQVKQKAQKLFSK